MSEQVRRYGKDLRYSGYGQYELVGICESESGDYVLHSDHLTALEAARAADKAEIERLRRELGEAGRVYEKLNQGLHTEIGVLRSRIAELEAKVQQADSLVNDREAVRKDAERWRAMCQLFVGTVFDADGKGISEFECPIPQFQYRGNPDLIADAAIAAAKEVSCKS